MKLIVMTQPTFFVEENKIIERLFESGLDMLHLYKPGSSPMYAERLLTLLPDNYYNKVVVHEHYYLKEEYKLQGIHLDDPSQNPPIGFRGHVSRTCTDLSMLKSMKNGSSYVFLDRVFSNTNIENVQLAHTHEQLKAAHKHGLIDRHVYAMGGITLENIHVAKDLGFGGVVVCSDLWNKFNIHSGTDYNQLLAHFDKLRKKI